MVIELLAYLMPPRLGGVIDLLRRDRIIRRRPIAQHNAAELRPQISRIGTSSTTA